LKKAIIQIFFLMWNFNNLLPQGQLNHGNGFAGEGVAKQT
jgi:hypothetical protein